MTMAARGIPKLIEECGELTQVLGKRLAYFTTDDHPDGKGSLRERIEWEMADVMAAIEFVGEQEGLDMAAVEVLVRKKLALFHRWDAQVDNNEHSVDSSSL